MIKSYTFREAVRADIPAMKFIRDGVKENALVSLNIGALEYEQGLFEDGKGWVCTFDDEIVGFSCGRLKQRDVWALFLDSRHEGRGLGHRLMELLETWMFEQGLSEIELSTQPGTRAEFLYRKRGWEETGMQGRDLGFRLTKERWLSRRS